MNRVSRMLASFAFGLIAASAQAADNVAFVNQSGLTVPGKLFKPAGDGPFPAIVMLHGCSGIYYNGNLQSTFQEWGDRLNQAGYVALLVDSFTPRGLTNGVCGNESGIEISERPKDAYAAYNFLSAQPYVNSAKVGLLGWSNGGSATLASMSASLVQGGVGPFRAAVAFYPGCGMYSAFGGIATSTYVPYAPTRILHGSADALFNDGYCTTRVQRAGAMGSSNLAMTTYPGAQHSFDLAKSGNSKWTASDFSAKSSGDYAAMSHFNALVR